MRVASVPGNVLLLIPQPVLTGSVQQLATYALAQATEIATCTGLGILTVTPLVPPTSLHIWQHLGKWLQLSLVLCCIRIQRRAPPEAGHGHNSKRTSSSAVLSSSVVVLESMALALIFFRSLSYTLHAQPPDVMTGATSPTAPCQ